jgi:hypothetical protein
MDSPKTTGLKRSSRENVLTPSIHSGQPRTVSFSGGYASTYSTETIGHSQASTSPGNVRNGSTAASTENRIKEAQVWAWLRDADRPWEGFGLPNVSSPQVVQKAAEVFPRTRGGRQLNLFKENGTKMT